MSKSGLRTEVLESANKQQKPWGFHRWSVTSQHNGNIMKCASMSVTLSSPWTWAIAKVPALRNGMSESIVTLLESVTWCLLGRIGNCTWLTKLSSIFRNSLQRWTSLQRVAFAEERRSSTKPGMRRWDFCTLVCISFPQCILFPSWWCMDTKDDKEEISGNRSSLMKAHGDTSTNAGMKSSRGGAPPSSRHAWRRRKYWVLSYSN